MKLVSINNETFEMTETRKADHRRTYGVLEAFGSIGFRTLDTYYKSYSRDKEKYWNEWLKWAKETEGVFAFAVSGANTYTFSIIGAMVLNEEEYVIHITKGHNRLYKIKRED